MNKCSHPSKPIPMKERVFMIFVWYHIDVTDIDFVVS